MTETFLLLLTAVDGKKPCAKQKEVFRSSRACFLLSQSSQEAVTIEVLIKFIVVEGVSTSTTPVYDSLQ